MQKCPKCGLVSPDRSARCECGFRFDLVQQAIKLLQLSREELVDTIRDQILKEPILEDAVDTSSEEPKTAAAANPASEEHVKTTDHLRISELVEAELSRIQDVDVREALRSILIAPRVQARQWDYGEPGEEYPCWSVAEIRELEMELAYCEHGFGPSSPWGAVVVAESSIGMDSQWHDTLEEVFMAFGGRDIVRKRKHETGAG